MARVQNRFMELKALKMRRESRSIPNVLVAEETGLSLSSVQNWAHNRVTRYDAHQISTLCQYFDCTIDELLILSENEEDPEPVSDVA